MSDFAYLGDCPLFRDLTLEQRAAVYAISDFVEYEAGATIFSEGELSDYLFVVCEGAVRISLETAGDGEEALAICEPGDSFGELDFLDAAAAARSATAIAHSTCGLARFSRRALTELSEREPALGYRIARNAIAELGQRIRRTNQKVRFFAHANLFA